MSRKVCIYFPLCLMPINTEFQLCQMLKTNVQQCKRSNSIYLHTYGRKWMWFRHTVIESFSNIWANESQFMDKRNNKVGAKFTKRNWNRKFQELKFTLCPQGTECVANCSNRTNERRRECVCNKKFESSKAKVKGLKYVVASTNVCKWV